MANQISLSQKQSMAALHAQGVSNRQIAKLLSLDRDTVSPHVRLLKPQNQPGAPPGIPRHFHRRARRSQCGTVNTTGPWEEEIVPSSTAEPDKVPAKVNAGGPASDVIWDDTGVPVQP